MLRIPFLVALALAIAFGGGIASSLAVLDTTATFGTLKIGPWVATPLAQTAAADPYAKARRAQQGRIALGQAEGLAFVATHDSAGRELSGRCAYRIAGQTPQSRLWTLRVTDPNGRLPAADPAFPQSLHSNSLLRGPDGTFAIALGARARPGNWLRLDRAGAVRFELTLFDTPAAGNSGVVDVTMPAIEQAGCRDA